MVPILMIRFTHSRFKNFIAKFALVAAVLVHVVVVNSQVVLFERQSTEFANNERVVVPFNVTFQINLADFFLTNGALPGQVDVIFMSAVPIFREHFLPADVTSVLLLFSQLLFGFLRCSHDALFVRLQVSFKTRLCDFFLAYWALFEHVRVALVFFQRRACRLRLSTDITNVLLYLLFVVRGQVFHFCELAFRDL